MQRFWPSNGHPHPGSEFRTPNSLHYERKAESKKVELISIGGAGVDVVMPQMGEWIFGRHQVAEESWRRKSSATLFEISTDKVRGNPRAAAGVLREIRVQEGDTVQVALPKWPRNRISIQRLSLELPSDVNPDGDRSGGTLEPLLERKVLFQSLVWSKSGGSCTS
jgi:hypothetical protein